MLKKVITGGESGANRAAWRAATAFGVATGGWMPKGFLVDDGSHPEFAAQFGAGEPPADSELTRIEQNIQDSDATIWFGTTTNASAHATVAACLTLGKPYMPIYPDAAFEASHVSTWIVENAVETLNVAGNREHEEPGIGEKVERFLGDVLQQLGQQRS